MSKTVHNSCREQKYCYSLSDPRIVKTFHAGNVATMADAAEILANYVAEMRNKPGDSLERWVRLTTVHDANQSHWVDKQTNQHIPYTAKMTTEAYVQMFKETYPDWEITVIDEFDCGYRMHGVRAWNKKTG